MAKKGGHNKVEAAAVSAASSAAAAAAAAAAPAEAEAAPHNRKLYSNSINNIIHTHIYDA